MIVALRLELARGSTRPPPAPEFVTYTLLVLLPGQFERRARAAATTGIVVAVTFFGMLAYWQAWRTDLATEDRNPRVLSAYRDPLRGRILDREGNVLAESQPDGRRTYADVSLAHVLGYIDPRYGSQGVELAFNGVLSGKRQEGWAGALDAEFRRGRAAGDDLLLTIDSRVQAAAAKALGGRRGAVVAIDPRNGEVLAMVSVPTYDPGNLEEDGEALLRDPASPLLNRATQGKYPPGSTFKVVTAAAALEQGVVKASTVVTCPGEIVIDGFPVSCRNTAQGVGTYPFSDAFAFSVNAIFADVGVKTGWADLEATARRFGFGGALDFTLDTAPTEITAHGSAGTRVLLASTAFGQGELLVTPLQMAMVAAIVANGGIAVRPHLGLAAMDGGRPGSALEADARRRVVDAAVARTLGEMMELVVSRGQAAGLTIPGVTVAGKTGTAETGRDGTSHAWFIAYAPADNPQIAVAVIVEDGGRGGEVASPIAGSILRAALQR